MNDIPNEGSKDVSKLPRIVFEVEIPIDYCIQARYHLKGWN
jgi:hypothetical protein